MTRAPAPWQLPRTRHPSPAVEAQLQRILSAQDAIRRRTDEADQLGQHLAETAERTRRRPGMPKTTQMEGDSVRVRQQLTALEAEVGALHDEIGALMDKLSPDDLAYLYPPRLGSPPRPGK